MPVNYHQPSVTALFDAMPAPLLTFGVTGLVTSANKAARNHPGRPVEAMSGVPIIKALVADITLGKIKIPYEADIELFDGLRLHGQFMAGPAGLDIAFVGQADASGVSGRERLNLGEIIALLRDEISPPMGKLEGLLKQVTGSELGENLEQAAAALNLRLKRLADLVEVFGDEVAIARDRIEILPLMQSVCSKLQTKAEPLGVYFDLQLPETTLPPVYGNAKLVERALHECLDNAITHSRREVNAQQKLAVDIRFTLSGEHVLISVRNKGATTLKVGKEAVQPFTAAKATAAPAVGGASAAPTATPRLGLPLVQRIVALHGGNMRMKTSDTDVHVLLEFPTGAPHRGQAQLDMAQAQRYAEDLAQLMSRRKKEVV
ncbi:hypothetical protein KIK84_01620 [Curvibacter sp. CHRR-16]|uniref:ATP-binding protein n=1 Tax=Curvibacter sp. CHRR-16 TaxID=2835872 RepID=UPI001BDA1E95|nr:ATP-binding protein [Curvibacter sp. CHRR-16]MBT0569014.1 hypothetical protein [Curvibacter sp. CHRR-16]